MLDDVVCTTTDVPPSRAVSILAVVTIALSSVESKFGDAVTFVSDPRSRIMMSFGSSNHVPDLPLCVTC